MTEIRDSRARLFFESLPYTMELMTPTEQSMKFVANFAKQTGDFAALSLTDLKLIALTHTLEQQHTDGKFIRKEPRNISIRKQLEVAKAKASVDATMLPTATAAASSEATIEQLTATLSLEENNKITSVSTTSVHESSEPDTQEESRETLEISDAEEAPDSDDDSEMEGHTNAYSDEGLIEADDQSMKNGECSHSISLDDTPLVPFEEVSRIKTAATAFTSTMPKKKHFDAWSTVPMKSLAEEDDGVGWINVSNLAARKGTFDAPRKLNKIPERAKTVACITNDFAMQNVLMQMGLMISAVDGQVIHTVKQFVLRCLGCRKIHYEMERLFCSSCGLAHLSKIAASIDSNTGELKLHLKKNYRVETRGTVFSLPKPGTQGRYDGEILLREDQLLSGIWRQKSVKIKKNITSAFGDDITSDVGLQINKGQRIQVGFGKKNPNAMKGRERRGKPKKN